MGKENNNKLDEFNQKFIYKQHRCQEFEEFIEKLLESEGFLIDEKESALKEHIRPDYIVHDKKTREKVVVELKIGTVMLETVHQMISYLNISGINRGLIITERVITSLAKRQAKRFNIDVWDGKYILRLCSKHGIKPPMFSSLIFKPKISTTEDLLIEELKNCKGGKKNYKGYEDICIKIFEHLFCPHLKHPRIQPKTIDGIEIRDAIFPNWAIEGVWKIIREILDARYIILECKNYDNCKIGSKEIYQVRNYLRRSIGRFGILCGRKVDGRSVRGPINRCFIEEEKIIICIDDNKLIEMLNIKKEGADPSSLISDLIDESFMKM